MKPKFLLIPTEKIPEIWDLIEPYVQEFSESKSSRTTVENLKNLFYSGKLRCWVVWLEEEQKIQAVVGVTVKQAENGEKIASIAMAQGYRRKDWIDIVKDIEEWARNEGCSVVQLSGRKGWARDLEDYKIRLYLMEKPLEMRV